MRVEEKAVLFDIREACTLIAQFTTGKSYADYVADAALRSAVERQFIVAGEALNRLARLDPHILNKIPDSRAIINFRNILVHGYDQVEDTVVWGIVQAHVAFLRDAVDGLLATP